MKLLVDENISPKIVDFLRDEGHDVKAVRNILKGAEDSTIAKCAISSNRAILTQDKDFGHIWYFSERGDIKVIVLRPRVQSIENLKQILDDFLPEIEDYGDNALFVVDESKYRIRK